MTRGFPILEFDPRREAVIEPRPLEAALPRDCVLCFFHEVIDRWRTDGTLRPIAAISTTIGVHPVYGWTHAGQEMALVHPGLGAPLAAVVLEELIASGCRVFVACGGAGVLRKDIAAGHLIVPTFAVRDDAVAGFRRVALGQILHGGDDVSGLTHDRREAFDRTAIRELLIRLAADACARMIDDGGVKQAHV